MKIAEVISKFPAIHALVNGVLFQVIWVVCVAGGASGFWWAGPVAVTFFAIWQIPRSANPIGEVKLVAVSALLGFGIDSALTKMDYLSYADQGGFGGMAPVWIVSLWVGFALTLNHSMSWLQGRPWTAALLGGIAGPFSYWIGAETWGAVEFSVSKLLVLAVLACVWAVITPALSILAERLGQEPESDGGLFLFPSPRPLPAPELFGSKTTHGGNTCLNE